jgi:AraC-type DNA-binding domain-containing proteins
MFLRIFLPYVVILVVLILVIGGINYYVSFSIVEEKVQDTNIKSVENIKNAYDKIFKDMKNISVILDSLPWLKNVIYMNGRIDYDRIEPNEFNYIISQFRAYKSNNKIIRNISLICRNTDFVINNDGTYSIDQYFHAYVYDSKEFNSYKDIDWGEKVGVKMVPRCKLTRYNVPQDDVVLYIKTLPLGDSNPRAALIIHLDWEGMRSILDQNNPDKNAEIAVLDEKGKLFQYLSDKSGIMPDQILPILGKGEKIVKSAGTSYIYYYDLSDYNRFIYVSKLNLKDAMAGVNMIRYTTFIIIAVVLILGLIISYFSARTSYFPIRRLFNKIGSYVQANKLEGINELDSIEYVIDKLNIEKNALRDDIEGYLPVIRNNALNRLLIDSRQEGIENELAKYGLQFTAPYYFISLTEIELMSEDNIERLIMDTTLRTILVKYMEKYFHERGDSCHVIEDDLCRFCLIVNTKLASVDDFTREFEVLIRTIKSMMESRFEITVASGISNIHTSISEVTEACNEARKAFDSKFIVVDSEIIRFDRITPGNIGDSVLTFEKEIQLANLLKTGDVSKVYEYIDTILDSNYFKKNTDTNEGIFILFEIASTAVKVLRETGRYEGRLVDFKHLTSMSSFVETAEYIKKILRKVCESINKSRISPSDQMLGRIIKYIDENYSSSDISLTVLSDRFKLSGAYLSSLIKEHLGCNFIDYVNKKRIEKAKVLLSDHTLLIKDIPSMVGFDSDINFRRVFKKHEAVTPGEYRENANK